MTMGPVEFLQPIRERTHGPCPMNGGHGFHGTPVKSRLWGDCLGPFGPVPFESVPERLPCARCSTGLPVPCVC